MSFFLKILLKSPKIWNGFSKRFLVFPITFQSLNLQFSYLLKSPKILNSVHRKKSLYLLFSVVQEEAPAECKVMGEEFDQTQYRGYGYNFLDAWGLINPNHHGYTFSNMVCTLG